MRIDANSEPRVSVSIALAALLFDRKLDAVESYSTDMEDAIKL